MGGSITDMTMHSKTEREGNAGPPAPSVTVLLPTYNERDNIRPLIESVFRHVPPGSEVVVVDDDSPDGTWRVVEDLMPSRPGLRLLRRTADRGLTASLRDGIAAARGEIIVWLDCDLSMPPEVIPDLLGGIARGADVAVGSRFVQGGGVEIVTGSGDTLMAYVLSRVLNRFVRTVLGGSFKDYTSGFIAVKREVLDAVPLRGDYGEYFIDLIHRARGRGFRIEEHPYLCRARKTGVSKTGTRFAHYLKKGWKYFGLTLRLKISRGS